RNRRARAQGDGPERLEPRRFLAQAERRLAMHGRGIVPVAERRAAKIGQEPSQLVDGQELGGRAAGQKRNPDRLPFGTRGQWLERKAKRIERTRRTRAPLRLEGRRIPLVAGERARHLVV